MTMFIRCDYTGLNNCCWNYHFQQHKHISFNCRHRKLNTPWQDTGAYDLPSQYVSNVSWVSSASLSMSHSLHSTDKHKHPFWLEIMHLPTQAGLLISHVCHERLSSIHPDSECT